MDEKEVMAKIEKMPMEEKIKLLSDTDKAYIRGYIERAILDLRSIDIQSTKQQRPQAAKPGKSG